MAKKKSILSFIKPFVPFLPEVETPLRQVSRHPDIVDKSERQIDMDLHWTFYLLDLLPDPFVRGGYQRWHRPSLYAQNDAGQ